MTKNDKILVLSCVVITAMVWAGFGLLAHNQDELVAVVVIDGKEIKRLPLDTGDLSVSYTHLDVYKRQE